MNVRASTSAIEWSGLRFRYASAEADALCGIDLGVPEGEFVLITGPTGCGKSTLLRTANGLIPRESAGRLEGTVSVFGQEASSIPSHLLRSWVGFLFQNPDDQLLCARVQEEVAFGPENLGEPPGAIAARVQDALEWAAVAEKRSAGCDTLSGGEKQRVALASALSLHPRLLVLDEPTSQLDGRGAERILQSLSAIREQLGLTILIAEHRIDRILPMADRLIVMERGSIRGAFARGRFLEALPLLRELELEVPAWMELAAAAGAEEAEGEEAVFARLKSSGAAVRLPEKSSPLKSESRLLRIHGVTHRYPKSASPALESVSADLLEGEILALMGHNGSGKTTLLSLLVGLLPIQEGEVTWFGKSRRRLSPRSLAGRVGFLFQNPDLMLNGETVQKEVELGPRLLGFAAQQAETAVAKSLDLVRLGGFRQRNPFSLSRGERLRVALAALLACAPQVLLLDEPTAGLDRGMRLRILEDLRRWVQEKGEKRAVILCTHDSDSALQFADRALVLRGGKVVAHGPIEEVMRQAGRGTLTDLEPSPLARIAQRMGPPRAPRTSAALIGGIAGGD